MKFTVPRSDLAAALSAVAHAAPTRATLPILASVRMQCDGKLLHLACTDLDVTLETAVAVVGAKPGATCVPAKLLTAIVKELPDADAVMSVEGGKLRIQSGAVSFDLLAVDVDEFPPVPAVGECGTLIDSAALLGALKCVACAQSDDESRYVLNAVRIEPKGDALAIVATDGRRMAYCGMPVESDLAATIPTKGVAELVRMLTGAADARLSANGTMFRAVCGLTALTCKLIDGTYPKWQAVIPDGHARTATINRAELLDAIDRAGLISKDGVAPATLSFARGKLTIRACAAEVGESTEVIRAKYDGDAAEITVSPDFMADPLRALTCDDVAIGFDGPEQALTMRADALVYVLMPMRVK